MKMTFIADDGIEGPPQSVGRIDYARTPDFAIAIRTEYDKLWAADAGSAEGYDEIITTDLGKIGPFLADDKQWVEHLRVPYGYLILTK
jgi:hypothetical protein